MVDEEASDDGCDEDRSIGFRIVCEVAEREGVDPLDLETPLYDAVNVDALESVLRSDASEARVTFVYYGYRVTVDETGSVSVTGIDE